MSRFADAGLYRFTAGLFLDPGSATARAPVAISACLNGEHVRYDGAAKRLAGIESLEQALRLIPTCPEVGAGLSVPRPAVQLVQVGARLQALGRDDSSLDVTAALERYAVESTTRFLRDKILCGYIWKSRSPSCGLDSTPLFNSLDQQIGVGSGIHASHFRRRLPWLHCVEESDLTNAEAIAAFVLLCRLNFDLLQTVPNALEKTHRHYQFLRRELSIDAQEHLVFLCESSRALDYQSALIAACAALNPGKLLRLFADPAAA